MANKLGGVNVVCRYFQVPKKLIEYLTAPEQEDEEDEDEDEEGVAERDEQLDQGVTEDRKPVEEDDQWHRFDRLVESWLDDNEDLNRPKQPQIQRYEDKEEEEDPVSQVLCARCYSLRHYGRVKSAIAETTLPGFDFAKAVGRKLSLQKFRRSIVLMVVDLSDFDGSLPRAAIRSLLPPHVPTFDVSKSPPPTFRLIVAANKFDLLPKAATRNRLEVWVRRRMAQGGLPRPHAVHIVSSTDGFGIPSLLADLQSSVGTRGDVWVIGAQNAGKSSLINAMRNAVGLSPGRTVTVAPVPGTTLGIVPVPSLLPRGCKMLDTPGVIHQHQISTSYLTPEETKLTLPRRPFRPRTYRVGPDHTVCLGGIARLDLVSCPGATLYLTIWASEQVTCHVGKTQGSAERQATHSGTLLVPPLPGRGQMSGKTSGKTNGKDGKDGNGVKGTKEKEEENIVFGNLVETNVTVSGDSWRDSSVDIVIAGLGWVAVGVDGRASFRVWTPPGVAITTREAMLPDYAERFEKLGFSSSMAPSKPAPKKRRK